MKKYRKTGAALLAAALLCAGGAAQAVELTVTSVDDLNGETMWSTHDWGITAPEDSISDNVVTIGSEGTSLDLSDKYISGGYSPDTTSVSGNRVTMKSGTVYSLYGGYGPSASVLGNTVNFSGDRANYVYGGWSENGSVERNTVTISGDGTIVQCDVYGGISMRNAAMGNNVIISGGTVNGRVYGGNSGSMDATGNTVTISGGTVAGTVYGGYSGGNKSVTGNTVTLTGTANVSGAQLYGGDNFYSWVQDNTLVVDNWSGTVGGLHNFESIHFTNLAVGKDTELNIAEGGTVTGMNGVTVFIDSIGAGDCKGGETYQNTLTWDDPLNLNVTKVAIASNLRNGQPGWISTDRVEGGLYVNQISYVNVAQDDQNASQVNISATVENSALTGKFIDSAGEAVDASQPLVIGDDFTTNVDTVAGSYAVGGQAASGGQVLVTGEVDYDGTVYAGYSKNGTVKNNNVYLDNTQAGSLHLLGQNEGSSEESGNNTLHVTGTGNTIGSVSNFDALSFDNLTWKDGATVLSITGETKDKQLSGTEVSVNGLSLAGGTPLSAGQSMTLLKSTQDMGLEDAGNIPLNGADDFTAGVAAVGKGTMAISEDGKQLTYRIDSVGLNPQTTAIAENRTAAAAFLNQGADIAADSLDLLGSDYKYGLRTFGAVYGSRSTWDAAGDLKINGWSEIVGLGNVHRKGDGDLSWGVFYENGTGNYRTWNEFNNEMFRGDGSLLYNGGGAAVRYQKDNGWYYEASVRAGTLSASMDNAVKDGNGQSYGFDSDSTYWGAHAGMGKVIETEQGEWNVYGKYFHTDIDGDSFNIAGDAFTFDSLTSDRLRIGARYTADKAKRWSLYYGLAWEYEFTGDSHMRAAGMTAPEQSLGGSTGIAEIGTVWQPDDSPWQANINLKGYAGEREGVSGMVQLAYTF